MEFQSFVNQLVTEFSFHKGRNQLRNDYLFRHSANEQMTNTVSSQQPLKLNVAGI